MSRGVWRAGVFCNTELKDIPLSKFIFTERVRLNFDVEIVFTFGKIHYSEIAKYSRWNSRQKTVCSG